VTLAVLELIESGRLQKMRNEWWFDKGECSGKDGPPKKVGSKHAAGQSWTWVGSIHGLGWDGLGQALASRANHGGEKSHILSQCCSLHSVNI